MITRDNQLDWNPLSEALTQPFITPRLWIIHTAVDGRGPTNLHNYFEQAGITLESHTWLRWNSHEQFIPFNRSADANYKANRFRLVPVVGKWYGAISTETEDDGNPEGNPWNDYQLEELIRFGAETIVGDLGIPAQVPGVWNGRGIGYHSLYPMLWTNVPGKTCPGLTRIRQFRNIVLPGIQAAIKPKPTTGDDMAVRLQTFRGAPVASGYPNPVGAKYKVISGKDKGGQEFDFMAVHVEEDEYAALKYIGMDDVTKSITVTADVLRLCTFVGGPFNNQ